MGNEIAKEIPKVVTRDNIEEVARLVYLSLKSADWEGKRVTQIDKKALLQLQNKTAKDKADTFALTFAKVSTSVLSSGAQFIGAIMTLSGIPAGNLVKVAGDIMVQTVNPMVDSHKAGQRSMYEHTYSMYQQQTQDIERLAQTFRDGIEQLKQEKKKGEQDIFDLARSIYSS